MFRIACCDDEAEQLEKLKDYFQNLLIQEDVDFDVDYYLSGDILLQKSMADREYYDVYFLDIEMDTMNGIVLAEELRKKVGKSPLIVFLTSYPQYMQQSFHVQVFEYLTKPVSYMSIKDTVGRCIRYLMEDEKSIVLKNMDSEEVVYRLPNIIFIEKIKGKNLMAGHQSTGVEHVHGNICDYEQALASNAFWRANRGCMINMRHIHKFLAKEIVMDNGGKISVSNRRMTELKEHFSRYIIKR